MEGNNNFLLHIMGPIKVEQNILISIQATIIKKIKVIVNVKRENNVIN